MKAEGKKTPLLIHSLTSLKDRQTDGRTDEFQLLILPSLSYVLILNTTVQLYILIFPQITIFGGIFYKLDINLNPKKKEKGRFKEEDTNQMYIFILVKIKDTLI